MIRIESPTFRDSVVIAYCHGHMFHPPHEPRRLSLAIREAEANLFYDFPVQPPPLFSLLFRAVIVLSLRAVNQRGWQDTQSSVNGTYFTTDKSESS